MELIQKVNESNDQELWQSEPISPTLKTEVEKQLGTGTKTELSEKLLS